MRNACGYLVMLCRHYQCTNIVRSRTYDQRWYTCDRGKVRTINLDTDQDRRAHLSSGAVGRWDLKDEYGGKPGEERRGEGTTGSEERGTGDVLG